MASARPTLIGLLNVPKKSPNLSQDSKKSSSKGQKSPGSLTTARRRTGNSSPKKGKKNDKPKNASRPNSHVTDLPNFSPNLQIRFNKLSNANNEPQTLVEEVTGNFFTKHYHSLASFLCPFSGNAKEKPVEIGSIFKQQPRLLNQAMLEKLYKKYKDYPEFYSSIQKENMTRRNSRLPTKEGAHTDRSGYENTFLNGSDLTDSDDSEGPAKTHSHAKGDWNLTHLDFDHFETDSRYHEDSDYLMMIQELRHLQSYIWIKNKALLSQSKKIGLALAILGICGLTYTYYFVTCLRFFIPLMGASSMMFLTGSMAFLVSRNEEAKLGSRSEFVKRKSLGY